MWLESAKAWLYDTAFGGAENSFSQPSDASLKYRPISVYFWFALCVAFWPLLLLAGLFIALPLYALSVPIRYLWQADSTRIYYKTHRNPRMTSILRRCRRLTKGFHPTWYTILWPFWNMSGHLQTMLHEFFRDTPSDMAFDREWLPTDDDGILALDYYRSCSNVQLVDWSEHSEAPVMLIIHGVVGGSHSHYVRHYAKLLTKNGFRVIVMNARGCSASELRTPRYFACHFTEDLRRVVHHITGRFRTAPVFATAYSLGANLLTKYCGEEGERCKLAAAIALANPFDWPVVSDHLLGGFLERHLYNFVLTKSLITFLGRHRPALEAYLADHDRIDFHRVMNVTTLQEYDTHLTCHLWGFDSLDEYYTAASGKNFLSSITIPFLTLQALDDPIIPATTIPYGEFLRNENLCLVTTKVGGHVGWLEKLIPKGNTWSDEAACEFVQSVMDHLVSSENRAQRKHAASEHTPEVGLEEI